MRITMRNIHLTENEAVFGGLIAFVVWTYIILPFGVIGMSAAELARFFG